MVWCRGYSVDVDEAAGAAPKAAVQAMAVNYALAHLERIAAFAFEWQGSAPVVAVFTACSRQCGVQASIAQ